MRELVIRTICRLPWGVPNVEIEITKIVNGVNTASIRSWWVVVWSFYRRHVTLTEVVPVRRSRSSIFGSQAGKILDAVLGVIVRLPRFLVVLIVLVRIF
jgi:hypothetical protein